jgi:hypothetical protein
MQTGKIEKEEAKKGRKGEKELILDSGQLPVNPKKPKLSKPSSLLLFSFSPLLPGQLVIRADNVARLGSDHQVRAHDANADLFAFADLADRFGIVTD